MSLKRYLTYHTILLVVLTWFTMTLSASAQLYDAYSSADSVTIGERFELIVSVEHDGSRRPVFPHEFLPDSLASRPVFEIGGFTILGNSPPQRRQISSGWVIDSLRYEVATFELDSAYVPMLPLGLTSTMDTLVAATPPVLVWITSLVPEDAEGIRDITDLALFPGLAWYWYVFVVLLLAALAYWFWKRRQKVEDEDETQIIAEPSEPPWEEAERRLRVLGQLDLAEPNNVKPFYVELSDIFRTYLARRANIPALESTTRELVERLQHALDSGMVPNEIVREVEGVLSEADLVKFAEFRPPSNEGLAALLRTKTAIEGTEEQFHVNEAQVDSDLSDETDSGPEILTVDRIE